MFCLFQSGLCLLRRYRFILHIISSYFKLYHTNYLPFHTRSCHVVYPLIARKTIFSFLLTFACLSFHVDFRCGKCFEYSAFAGWCATQFRFETGSMVLPENIEEMAHAASIQQHEKQQDKSKSLNSQEQSLVGIDDSNVLFHRISII